MLKDTKIGEPPVEPYRVRILLESTKRGCADQIFALVAMPSVEHTFVKPGDVNKQEQALIRRRQLTNQDGDHFTMTTRGFIERASLT